MKMKCVIILDKELPIGLMTNTSAALGLSIGSHINGLTGPEVRDKENVTYKGITNIPIPILMLDKEKIKEIHDRYKRLNLENVTIIGFSTVAQQCKNYETYQDKIKNYKTDEIQYMGLGIYGPKKAVNTISGSIEILK